MLPSLRFRSAREEKLTSVNQAAPKALKVSPDPEGSLRDKQGWAFGTCSCCAERGSFVEARSRQREGMTLLDNSSEAQCVSLRLLAAFFPSACSLLEPQSPGPLCFTPFPPAEI